jgi:high affinity Mn2+ porin
MEPTTANGAEYDGRFGCHNGNAVEWEQRIGSAERPGAVRVLGFLNHAEAGAYREATILALQTRSAPDLDSSRRIGTPKYGFGLNIEQALSKDVGTFARYGWNDGKTETWAFTEIDRSLSGGVSIGGRLWHRREDRIGAATASNRISGDHAAYLAAAGYGLLLGDGALNYRPESVFEVYYAAAVGAGFIVTLDFQHVTNPAYNHARGPVSVGTLRLHCGSTLRKRP